MPTSSQVLILRKKIHGIPISGKSSPCLFKEEMKCAVAGVYNLHGCMPLSGKSVADEDAVTILGRESAQLFKYHSLPHGYSSILSLDKLSGLLKWQALGGQENQGYIIPQSSESEEGFQRRCKSELANESPADRLSKRPRSAVSAQTSKTHVDPLVFDSLIKLGFNRSTLVKRVDCVFDSISSRKPVSSKLWAKTKETQTAASSTASETQPDVKPDDKDVTKTDSKDSLSGLSSDGEEQCEGNRVKPSMHMRSDVPDLRPRAAIFSFRDNEFTTHAEVKYLIETQIGVRVKSIQFDPLDVRSGKPGVHSRWIVDFFSDWDLHVALKNGLKVGKDKLLFYKHDDIAKREVSSFKYYMTVQDAKKKLKSKSLTSRPNAKRPAKSVKSLN